MLSYSFLTNKMMSRILGYQDVAKHFKLLQSAEKKRYGRDLGQDSEELGFAFERPV